jgi:hypothetical protein
MSSLLLTLVLANCLRGCLSTKDLVHLATKNFVCDSLSDRSNYLCRAIAFLLLITNSLLSRAARCKGHLRERLQVRLL